MTAGGAANSQTLDHGGRHVQNHTTLGDLDTPILRPYDAPLEDVVKSGHEALPLQNLPVAAMHDDERGVFLYDPVRPGEIEVQSRC